MVRDGILRGRGLRVVLIEHPSCLNPLALYLFTAFSLSHSFTWLSSAHDTPTFVCPFPALHTSCRTKDTEVETFCYRSVLVGRAGRSKNGRRHFKLILCWRNCVSQWRSTVLRKKRSFLPNISIYCCISHHQIATDDDIRNNKSRYSAKKHRFFC